jgi:hypothetical protein
MPNDFPEKVPPVPVSTDPAVLFPEDGPEITVSLTEDEGVTIKRSRFWKCIFAASLEPGSSEEFTIAFKSGMSRSRVTEIGTSLKLLGAAVGAAIAAKLSSTVNFTEETTSTLKATVTAPQDGTLTYLRLQLIERVRIVVLHRRLFHMPERREAQVDNPLNITKSCYLFYPAESPSPARRKASAA